MPLCVLIYYLSKAYKAPFLLKEISIYMLNKWCMIYVLPSCVGFVWKICLFQFSSFFAVVFCSVPEGFPEENIFQCNGIENLFLEFMGDTFYWI